MKDFDKLMKERNHIDNKSQKRMTVVKPGATVDYDSKVKIYAAPSLKKGFKKTNKVLAQILEKQMYHKRVKSDQIYSVKLLMRGEDKINKNKAKLINNSKQPSLTRPFSNQTKSTNHKGYSKFGIKKGIDFQQSLIQSNSNKNSFKSENLTPKKLDSLQKINYQANCLVQAKSNVNRLN